MGMNIELNHLFKDLTMVINIELNHSYINIVRLLKIFVNTKDNVFYLSPILYHKQDFFQYHILNPKSRFFCKSYF